MNQKKIVLGIVIMFVGVFLLLNNFGLISWTIYHLVISWQAILIAIGFVLLFDKKENHNNKTSGAILILIGAIFLLPRIFPWDISDLLIPALVILIGILFIIKAVKQKSRRNNRYGSFSAQGNGDYSNMPYTETSLNDENHIRREYVFTASKEKWTFGKIKSIDVNAIFSGIELDLTQIGLSENTDTVFIKLSAVFSGITLYVPDDWNLIIRKTGSFGGFNDNRPRNAIQQSANGKTVRIECEAVFGGGEIKCYE
jgi:predicted membrane protein